MPNVNPCFITVNSTHPFKVDDLGLDFISCVLCDNAYDDNTD